MLRRIIANFSRLACAFTGGPAGKTLCWRAAMRWGDDCLLCRLVGRVMREPHHCADELSARDIYERAKRIKKMKFIPDWRRVLRRAWSNVRAWLIPDAGTVVKRAWSLRLIELAAVADIILNFVPFMADYMPWWATLALLGGAWIARHVAQPKEKPNAIE